MMSSMQDDTITVTDATRLTGRSRATIYNWIKSGRLPVVVDIPRRRLLRREDVLAAARITDHSGSRVGGQPSAPAHPPVSAPSREPESAPEPEPEPGRSVVTAA